MRSSQQNLMKDMVFLRAIYKKSCYKRVIYKIKRGLYCQNEGIHHRYRNVSYYKNEQEID